MSSMVLRPVQTHIHQNMPEVLHAYIQCSRDKVFFISGLSCCFFSTQLCDVQLYNETGGEMFCYCFETLWLHKSLCFFLLPKVWFSFLASVHYFQKNGKLALEKRNSLKLALRADISFLFSFYLNRLFSTCLLVQTHIRSEICLQFYDQTETCQNPILTKRHSP